MVTSDHVPLAIWAGFALMCLAMFMAILDIQVVATSLPAIQSALSIPPDAISWIQTAYLIAEVIAIPLSGWLTRAASMRWLFVAAMALFTVASAGCAASNGFGMLVAFRSLQGFAGGLLIPLVFTAGVRLYPRSRQPLATALAGFVAALAPTLGPWVGGWITQTYSWHWLFLLNIAPGVMALALVPLLLPREDSDPALVRQLDVLSLLLLAATLAAVEIGLKQAPRDGWHSAICLSLFATSVAGMLLFTARTWRRRNPIVELRTLARRNFAVACVLSFFLGAGLYGSVYLMPVFLGFARGYNAVEIGSIMLVTGAAQLATAPLAVMLDKRLNPLVLSSVGFLLLAMGLGMSAVQTGDTDFDAMFWPQVVRGIAVMFCLVAPTRLALAGLPEAIVPDASALFNLMRNLGGAIGIALTDTILFGRTPGHVLALTERLLAGDPDAARLIGAEPDALPAAAVLRPLIEKAGFITSCNEAWIFLAFCMVLALAAGAGIGRALLDQSASDVTVYPPPQARASPPQPGRASRPPAASAKCPQHVRPGAR